MGHSLIIFQEMHNLLSSTRVKNYLTPLVTRLFVNIHLKILVVIKKASPRFVDQQVVAILLGKHV